MSETTDIVARLSGMSTDHGPDGWPAVQMRDITALCDEVARLRAALAAQAPQWLPIESAPKDGTLFLCWVSAVCYGETDEGQQYQQDASQVDFCSWRDGPSGLPGHGYFDPCCGQIADGQDVTHWMPLPAAPGASPPPAAPAEHRQGCDALGGYGHGIGPCTCGFDAPVFGDKADAAVDAALAASQESATTRGRG